MIIKLLIKKVGKISLGVLNDFTKNCKYSF